MRSCFFLVAISAAAVTTACRVPNNNSSAKIDDGISIDQTSKNKISAVYDVLVKFGGSAGGCTGTAVSDSVLVFAAHCVENGGYRTTTQTATSAARAEVCVSNVLLKNVCTKTTFVPKNYAQNAARKMAFDVAVSVFPQGTFQTYAEVTNVAAPIGEKVLLVGYSEDKLPNGASPKRWGKNTISQKLSDITLVSTANGTSAKVGVSPGDSGGPMFDEQCRLVGVASRMNIGSVKENLHTSLGWIENSDWLKGLKDLGANLCGLDADRASCNSSARYLPTESDGFPCIEAGVSGSDDNSSSSTDQPALNPAKVDAILLAESQDSGKETFYLSASTRHALQASNLHACTVIDVEKATKKSDCIGALQVATFDRKKSEQDIFRVSLTPAAAKEWGIVVFEGDFVVGRFRLTSN